MKLNYILYNMNNDIPDLEKLTNDVLKFIDFIDNPENRKMKEENIGNFNFLINENFPNLPYAMIKLLTDYENRTQNLEKILDMINLLRSVKFGTKTLENAENEFIEKRAEEYLYPAFGGKEEFYRVAEENKKNKKKGKK
jgi:hypothetical protein